MANLAINGGKAISETRLPVPEWPPVKESTVEKLKEIYLSRQWSFNSAAEQAFETEFAAYHGARYGIFMSNGTVTLECALEALGIGPGDEVIVPALTWIATAMAVRYVGATPVFADIEPTTLCLDPKAAEAAITPATRAIIPVHLYGGMADLEALQAIADRHQLAIVEDCAHMQGGLWNGRGVGSWGAVGSFSFQQSKTLAAGESGICLTNDPKLAELLYRAKHIGYSRYDKQGQAGTPPPVGLTCHNYRGLALQAQILRDQLTDLKALIQRYGQSAAILADAVAGIPGIRLQSPGRLASPQGYYALGVIVDGPEWHDIPIPRIIEAIAAEGMGCINGTYGSVYRHLLFNMAPSEYRLPAGGCPVADGLGSLRTAVIMHYALYYPETAEALGRILQKLAANVAELKK